MAAISASILPVYLISVLAQPIEQSFHYGPAMVGEVTALLLICSSVAAVASGWAVDRLGGRNVLVGSMTGLILSMVLIGLASQRSVLLCVVVLCGICSGAVPPASYRLLWDHIAMTRQGTAFGVIQAGFPGATVFVGLMAPAVAGAFGWRAAFFGASVVTVLVASCAFLLFKMPFESGQLEAGRRESAPASSGHGASRPLPWHRALVLLATVSLLGNAGAGVLTTYSVVYRMSRGSSNGVAGYYFALGGLVAAGVRLVLGRWADHHRGKASVMTTVLLIGGCAGVVLLSLPVGWLAVPSTIIAFGSGWGWSGLLGLTVTRMFASMPGLSTGLVITTAGGAGAAAGPAIVSRILGVAGYPFAWGFAGACFVGGAVTVWYLNRLFVRADRAAVAARPEDREPDLE